MSLFAASGWTFFVVGVVLVIAPFGTMVLYHYLDKCLEKSTPCSGGHAWVMVTVVRTPPVVPVVVRGRVNVCMRCAATDVVWPWRHLQETLTMEERVHLQNEVLRSAMALF